MSCQRNASCGVSGWVNVTQQQARVLGGVCTFFSSTAGAFLLPQYCAAFWKPTREVVRVLSLKGKGTCSVFLQRPVGRKREPAPRGCGNCTPTGCGARQQPPAQLRCCGHRHISAKTSSVLMELQQCLLLSQLCLKRLDPLLKPVWWCKLGPGASKVFV